MHPTRTTTKLLLGVACAVSAVSGCVNVNPVAVQPAASAEPSAEPGDPQYEPRGGRGPAAEPVVVQAPALEALEAAPDAPRGAARSAAGDAKAGTRARTGPAAGTPRGGTAHESPGRSGPEPVAAPVDDGVEPPLPPSGPTRVHPGRHHPAKGGPQGPEALPEVPLRPADVCAMGRKFGQWKKDSPESRICSGVYGE